MSTLVELDIKTVSDKIRNKEISVTEMIEAYISSIKKLNPQINGMITFDEEQALKDARNRDDEIAKNEYRGTLHGIPISLKDIIDTKDFPTTMGSKIYQNNYPDTDASVVKALKSAGAIIIGKSNTEQFAFGVTGTQSYFGSVKNPYNSARCSGGSSSGSAASVAARLNLASIGTDTGGSIRIPSSLCGVVGMKPTYGTISNWGIYPVSQSLDHLGPVTRSVYDNAIVLDGMINEWPSETRGSSYSRLIDQPVTGLTIGVPYNIVEHICHRDILENFYNSLAKLEEAGCVIVDIKIDHYQQMIEAHDVILKRDAYQNNEYNLKNYELEWYVPQIRDRLLSGKEISDRTYQNATLIQNKSIKIFDQLFKKVDVMMFPSVAYSTPGLDNPFVDIGNNEKVEIGSVATILTRVMNLNGFPALTLPIGQFSSDSMPIGMQIIAKRFNESRIYQVADKLEKMQGTFPSPAI